MRAKQKETFTQDRAIARAIAAIDAFTHWCYDALSVTEASRRLCHGTFALC
jgi:hypothetical protein